LPQAVEPIKNKVTLFVKSLHRDTTEKQLEELFKQFGLLQVRLPRDEASGHHRGIAFVDVDSQVNAEKALVCNGVLVCGRNIEVYLSKPPAETSQDVKERTAFLSHIPADANEHDIRQLLESKDCQVEEVRLIRDLQSGKAKGFAYVQLKDHRSY
jgi:RNA recognition motif-containing protein